MVLVMVDDKTGVQISFQFLGFTPEVL